MYHTEAANELMPNLITGEKLIWAGKPRKGITFRSADIMPFIMGLMITFFSLNWQMSMTDTSAPFIFKVWGIPFLIYGIYLVIGRFLVAAYKRTNTVYGVTSDRIIIKSGIFQRDIQSLNIKTLTDISFHEKSDNSGTIMFGKVQISPYMSTRMPGLVPEPPSFERIDDVKNVYQKIIEIQQQR